MGDEDGNSLLKTPTWAAATVCFFLIVLSILIEHGIQQLSKYFNNRRKKSLSQALNKIKSELMLFGFISLLLSACAKPITNICISERAGKTFLPCSNSDKIHDVKEEDSGCAKQGHLCLQGEVSFLSREGTRQLQFLIFVMALFHSFSCVLTFSLGMAKMKEWESWEAETRTLEYQYTNDPRRFRLVHQTSFAKRHLRYWSGHRFLRWPACFVRQFYGSVCKVDYLTLRHGFIMAHFTPGSSYNFQNYIRRVLEKDFGVVVGISLRNWIFCVLSIFFNAQSFYSYLWLPCIPLVMLLLVGTKLQEIITKMCLDSTKQSVVVRGTFLVRPSDDFFWFRRPKLLLHLMHIILFQNSFQLAFFTWTWYKFGLRSCFHQETANIAIRVVMGVPVHFLCGYVTLPLYALVTQMGTSMDLKGVLTDSILHGLKKWRAKAKKNAALRSNNTSTRPSIDMSSLDVSLNPSPSFSIDAAFHVSVDRPEELSNHKYFDEVDFISGQHQDHHKLGSSFRGFGLGKSF